MEPRPFIGLLILDVINRFIFGHGEVNYNICKHKIYQKNFPRKHTLNLKKHLHMTLLTLNVLAHHTLLLADLLKLLLALALTTCYLAK